jgi:hypothetical protein
MAGKADAQLGGKRAELYVAGELLKLGVVPYVPMVDVEGVDAVVHTPSGKLLAIQVKGSGVAGSPSPRWFIFGDVPPRPELFLIGVAVSEGKVQEAWIFPASVYRKYAPIRPKGDWGIDLDKGKRKYGMPLRDLLCGFRNRWELITNYERYETLMESPEDLEDLLAMKEATETSEEEVLTLEQYDRRRSAALPS